VNGPPVTAHIQHHFFSFISHYFQVSFLLLSFGFVSVSKKFPAFSALASVLNFVFVYDILSRFQVQDQPVVKNSNVNYIIM